MPKLAETDIVHFKAECHDFFSACIPKRQMFPNNRDTGPARPVGNISAKIWNNSALGGATCNERRNYVNPSNSLSERSLFVSC
jgi:hypothetical protein